MGTYTIGEIGAREQHSWSDSSQSNGNSNTVRGARALGWFSIGLGAAELIAPRQLGRLIGVRGHEALIRSMGVREIAAGIAVLLEKKPARSMVSRVAGDAVDIALLGAGLASGRTHKGKLGGAIGAVAAVTALDVLYTVRLHNGQGLSNVIRTIQTIAVNRSPEECYRFWRDFENLPRFMKHLESVRVTGDRRSHWAVTGPAGSTLEWDAELIHDTPNRIAWRSLEGADVDNSGSVEFERAPGGRGTIVKASLQYSPPGGKAGALISKLFGEEPSIQAKTDLRRFKAAIETGEVPTIEGQSSGRRLSTT
jgi:uncharacterized membrane protein